MRKPKVSKKMRRPFSIGFGPISMGQHMIKEREKEHGFALQFSNKTTLPNQRIHWNSF
jgi:hypothetical protein